MCGRAAYLNPRRGAAVGKDAYAGLAAVAVQDRHTRRASRDDQDGLDSVPLPRDEATPRPNGEARPGRRHLQTVRKDERKLARLGRGRRLGGTRVDIEAAAVLASSVQRPASTLDASEAASRVMRAMREDVPAEAQPALPSMGRCVTRNSGRGPRAGGTGTLWATSCLPYLREAAAGDEPDLRGVAKSDWARGVASRQHNQRARGWRHCPTRATRARRCQH